jgi:hypothetical protein
MSWYPPHELYQKRSESMHKEKPPVGHSDSKNLREQEFYYIDVSVKHKKNFKEVFDERS